MKTAYDLTAALIALMVVQSVLGLAFQTEYLDVDWIRATWFGNDWVTLALAVPLLAIAVAKARGGSTRSVLLWFGSLGYAIYNYAYYLLGTALNAFLPLYVSAFVLSVVILIVGLSRVDQDVVAASFAHGTHVQLIGGYLTFFGVGLASVWVTMWAAHAFAHQPTPVDPQVFKLVAALDISMMATTLTFGGVLLWQREPWGYIVAAIAAIQASLYLVVLFVNSIVQVHRGFTKAPGEAPLWCILAAVTTAVTLLFLTKSRAGAERSLLTAVIGSGH